MSEIKTKSVFDLKIELLESSKNLLLASEKRIHLQDIPFKQPDLKEEWAAIGVFACMQVIALTALLFAPQHELLLLGNFLLATTT